MTAPDDTTLPAEPETEAIVEKKPLRRGVADRWNSLNLAGKVVAVGGIAAALATGYLAYATTDDHDADEEHATGGATAADASLPQPTEPADLPRAAPQYKAVEWPVRDHMRKGRPVRGHTRQRRKPLAEAGE
ncbi:hypothetical protein ACFV3R_25020 [Streptomyces sp. NPDC059740]|uniref:hypothetical protein n=1 Tax=Streptomyces sp. NPDC059740 TaxID=3346926 RepID=UPI003657245F